MSAATRSREPDTSTPEFGERGVQPELFHLYCCDPSVALCGWSLSGVAETDGEGEMECAVCAAEDERLPADSCPRCARSPGL